MKIFLHRKKIAIFLLSTFLLGEFSHFQLLAKSSFYGGPGSPEVQSFHPTEVTELVNPAQTEPIKSRNDRTQIM